MGQGLCHRLADRGRDRVHDHAECRRLTDRIVARLERTSLMLSALDLARRIEAGESDAARGRRDVRQAIAARESEIGAFTALDIDGAATRAPPTASHRCRCAACRSA